MRLLFIGPLPEPITGQSLACKVLLDELVKTHEVEVVNISKGGFAQGADSIRRVAEIARHVWHIWRENRKADVIYLTVAESRAGNAKDLISYVLCFTKLPRMLVHLHGGAGLRELLSAPHSLTRRLNNFFLRRLGGIIVLGERHVSIFSPSVSRDKIHIVPNFAEDYLFSTADEINRKFQSADPLRLLFVSNLLPGKGHLELLEAFSLLEDAHKKCMQIDFAGGFETEVQKQTFLNRISAWPQLAYHGTVHGQKKKELFTGAHVFCLPTYYPYEGQPISILEAYAAGCTVITTDHSGIFDVFQDGVNGYAVEKRSAVSLKNAIMMALANTSQVRAMALHNNFTADQSYHSTTFVSALADLIDATAAGV